MLLADLRRDGLTNLLVQDQVTKLWKIRGDLNDAQKAVGKKSVATVLGKIREEIHAGRML